MRTPTRGPRPVNTDCGKCGHEFVAGELRYRADDGKDYCTQNGCGQAKWREENTGSAR